MESGTNKPQIISTNVHLKTSMKPGEVVHGFSPSTWVQRQSRISKFEASRVYVVKFQDKQGCTVRPEREHGLVPLPFQADEKGNRSSAP